MFEYYSDELLSSAGVLALYAEHTLDTAGQRVFGD